MNDLFKTGSLRKVWRHYIVCSSLIYGLWLPLWYLQDIMLSVLLWNTNLITPLVSSRHYVVCSSLKYGFDYPCGIFKTLCCLFFFDIRIWLPLWYLQDIMLSVLLWCTDLITPLVSSRHYVVCSSSIYGFDYSFGIFSTLCCLFFFDIRILITPSYLQDIALSVLLWCTDYGYPFDIFKTLCCLFFFDIRIWLPLWYLQHTVLSVLLRYTDYDYSFGIFKTLRCLFFFDIRILITPLVSSRNCAVCSSIYGFWLHLWYLQTTLININTDMNNTGLNNRGEVADW